MRILLIPILIAALATPAMAQAPNRQAWEAKMGDQSLMLALLPACKRMGYHIYEQTAEDEYNKVLQSASSFGVGMVEATTFANATHQRHLAMVPQSLDTTQDPKVVIKANIDLFDKWASTCEMVDPLTEGIDAGLFPTSGRSQTYIQYVEFYAEQGELDDVVYAGYVYALNMAPDPGQARRIKWHTLAAERGSGTAAYMLAMYYGEGVQVTTPDPARGLMWQIIAETYGQPDERNLGPKFKAALSPSRVAQVRNDAAAWLKPQ